MRTPFEVSRYRTIATASLCTLWFGCASAPVAPPGDAEPKRLPAANPARPISEGAPSRVILITIDTLRADYVGCYGATHVKTPNLDRIAADGVRFETAISPAPITMPAHSSLMTGLDPPRHGVHSNGKFRLPDQIPTLAEQFKRAGYTTAGFVSAVVLDSRYGLNRGFDVYDDQMGFRRNIRGTTGAYAERTASQVVDAVVSWLETAPDRFFLWVHFYDPHGNYSPPKGFRPKSKGPRPNVDKIGIIEAAKIMFPPAYAGEIYYTDTELGRLLRVVRNRYRDDRTLLAVTSDHGESLGEHGELTHTLTVYDATQKVPLLLSGPGLPKGHVVDAPVRLIDVAPTLLELSGAAPLAGISGQSLMPWVRGERSDALPAYVETLETQLGYGWSPVLGVRTDRYKYLRTVRPELYDLQRDPRELRNIASQSESTATRLDHTLNDHLSGALAVEPNIVAPVEEIALLESLGYVASDSAVDAQPLGWVGGDDPKDAIVSFVRLLEARTALAAGKPRQARKILASEPAAGGWVYQTRAEIALALDDGEEAERMARLMIAAQPVQAEGYLALGHALELLRRYREAATAFGEAARINPNETDSLVGLGRLAEKSGHVSEAIDHYRAALDSNAPNPDAALRLAALYFDLGKKADADRLLTRDLGGSARAVARAARAQARAGDREAAVARVRRAIKIGPTHPRLRAALADLEESDD